MTDPGLPEAFLERYRAAGGSETGTEAVLQDLERAYMQRAVEQVRADGAERRLSVLGARYAELERSERRFRSLVSNSSDALVVVDRSSRVTYASPSVLAVWGRLPSELEGRLLLEYVHSADMAALYGVVRDATRNGGHEGAPVASHGSTVVRVLTAEGRVRHLEVTVANLLGEPAVAGIVITSRDVTEQRALEDRLDYLAYHDALTALPNRAAFLRHLQEAVPRARLLRAPLSVIVVDVDRFKLVNESQGHSAGDRTLELIASELRAFLGEQGVLVARLGGDEFGVVLDAADREDAAALAEGLVAAITEEPGDALESAGITVSAGVASLADVGSASPTELLQAAGVALFQAKRRGRGQVARYDDRTRADFEDRFRLEADLHGVARRGELVVEFQPIVRVPSGELYAMEALVRWQHPSRGRIAPDRFIGMAEESGEIVEIGRWVLRAACRQLREWDAAASDGNGVGPAYVSVNASAAELRDPSYVVGLASLLAEYAIEPSRLQLEITESVLVEDAKFMLDRMGELKALGVRLAIDDFGTGYSSLSYLASMPLDAMKVDRSFVAGMHGNARMSSVVRATLTLAQTLGLTVVAEGVETEEQARALAALGCEFAQGYRYARPLSVEAATRLVALHNATRALRAA